MSAKNTKTPGESHSQVLNLKDSVAYQVGSIVSRTIVDKRGGTVTVFAFDENQGLSEHKAPFDALLLVIEGETDVTISGETSRLKEGEMIIMPTNKPHALRAVTRFKMILIMIRGKLSQ